MSFSSGTFTLAAGNPVTTLTTISSSWANTTLSDIATGLSTCMLKDGTQTQTANLPMSSFKLTGLGAGSTNGDSLRYEQVFTTSTGSLSLLGGLFVPAIVSASGAINMVQAATLTATATIAIGSMTGNYAVVTGTATVSSFDTVRAGALRILEWSGVTPLSNSANLILPGGANLTTATGDASIVISEGAGNWRIVNHQRAASAPLAYATQSDMEAASSLSIAVTPGRQQSHPSAAKAWANIAGGTGAANAAYGCTTARDSTGIYTVTWSTAFSSVNYTVVAHVRDDGANLIAQTQSTAFAAGSCKIQVRNGAGMVTDPNALMLEAYGDQ